MHSPRTHRCDVPDLDYSRVKAGHIECTECGREYYFIPGKGWRSEPFAKHTFIPARVE